MHYHLMGIGGIGVSGLARLLLAHGHQVSGCDLSTGGLAAQLANQGVQVYAGHHADHITPDVNVLAISTAIDDNHPEVAAARAQGVQVLRRIEVLGQLMEQHPSVGVVGTHGKTTTSSMVAVALLGADLDPSALIGGEVPELGGSNARAGQGPLVAEVDESDTRFQYLRPHIAIITNAEDDHVATPGETRANYHASLEALMEAFERYATNAKTVIYCADWPGLAELCAKNPQRVSYGSQADADYRLDNIRHADQGIAYDAYKYGELWCSVQLSLPGMHNALNSLSALVAADLLGADIAKASEALGKFKGAGRRWEHKGKLGGALVIDDYAHHPTEVAATIEAARLTGRRVRVVFQPHRYLRTAQVWPRFAETLMDADDVLLLDVFAAGEQPIAGVHSRNIESKMQADGHQNVRYFADHGEAIAHLQASVQDNDLILTMGAGDVTRLGPLLLERQA